MEVLKSHLNIKHVYNKTRIEIDGTINTNVVSDKIYIFLFNSSNKN